MRRLIYIASPFLALLDAVTGVLLVVLFGGFENGTAVATASSMAIVLIVAACVWMFCNSMKELLNIQHAPHPMQYFEPSRTVPATESEKTNASDSSSEGSASGALAPSISIPVHDVGGFMKLSTAFMGSFSMQEATKWLAACRSAGAYSMALPCDGHVFIDARSTTFSNAWIFGDVHGDVAALSAVFAFADKWSHDNSASPPSFFSLGDLFDRGDKSAEAISLFICEAKKRQGMVGWLAGNHDNGFLFDEKRGIFASHTFPNEFTMWLNAHLQDADIVAFGREVALLCGRLPAAAIIPGDVLLVHGGVPHKDIQPRIASPADLENSDMKHDFIWGRFHDTLKRKRPSREANCQLGVLDVQDFLSILNDSCGMPCKAILRGHDHFSERIRIYDAYAPLAVVTLNTCSTLKDGAYSAKPLDFTPPAVAHCFNGQLELFRIAR